MKKRSILISAALTIALCLCLIAGSTYAIFTSSAEQNIAVTAGKVQITASTSGLNTYTELTAGNVTYTNSAAEADGSVLFENKGYAKFEDVLNDAGEVVKANVLKLVNMTPGDGVNFDINVDNSNTNVAVQYRVVLYMKGDLAPALEVSVSDAASGREISVPVDTDYGTDGIEKTSGWVLIDVTELDNFGPISINVFFPNGTAEHDNVFQGKTCEISIRLEVVQANTDTSVDVIVP